MRGRVGTANVNQAARFAVQELLPNAALDSCYSSLPAPLRMRAGATWTSNLDPSGSGAKAKSGTVEAVRPSDLLPPG